MSIVQSVRNVLPTEVPQNSQSRYPKGYINVFTIFNRPDRQQQDREHLDDLLARYKAGGDIEEYIIFKNNTERLSFQVLSRIPKEAIRRVHMITTKEAQAFFGKQEAYPIIYLYIDGEMTD